MIHVSDYENIPLRLIAENPRNVLAQLNSVKRKGTSLYENVGVSSLELGQMISKFLDTTRVYISRVSTDNIIIPVSSFELSFQI